MREIKYHTYLDSLVELKNQLIQQGRYTDCVDEIICKAMLDTLKCNEIRNGGK